MAEIPKEVAKQLDSTAENNNPAEKILHENKAGGDQHLAKVVNLPDSVHISDGPAAKLELAQYQPIVNQVLGMPPDERQNAKNVVQYFVDKYPQHSINQGVMDMIT